MSDTGGDGANPVALAPRLRPVPTTAAQRWEEYLDAIEDGMVVIDAEDRIVAFTDRFSESLGIDATDLEDAVLRSIVPELAAHAHMLDGLLGAGRTASIEIERPNASGRRTWQRLTFVPRRSADDGRAATMVLATDLTTLRTAQRKRLLAQQRLTMVEEEVRRRVGLDLHDGPIHLLAAITLHLSVLSEPVRSAREMQALDAAVADATHQLREMLHELTDTDDEPPAGKLRRWLTPLVEGTTIELSLDDRSARLPDLATTQAMFVFVHEVIETAKQWSHRRRLQVTIDDESDGHRLEIAVHRSTADRIRYGRVPMQVDAANRFAMSLGGTYRHDMVAPDVRLISVWLPARSDADDPAPQADAGHWATARGRARHGTGGRSVPPWELLTDQDLDEATRAIRVGITEIDAAGLVVSVNEVAAEAIGVTPSEAVGHRLMDLLSDEYVEVARGFGERLVGGEVIRIESRSPDTSGERDWVDVVLSPRADADGAFAGALLVTRDITQEHFARHLEDVVLGAVERARRDANVELAHRIRSGPLQRLTDVVELLRTVTSMSDAPEAFAAIRDALDDSVTSLLGSIDRIARPDVPDGDLERALRSSLTAMWAATPTRLVVAGTIRRPVPSDDASTLLAIAREAVVNAIRHGRAEQVVVRFDEVDGCLEVEVVDDGTGISDDALQRVDGHLGVRSMRERCAERGGSLVIEPHLRGGTRVLASIPRRAQE